MGHRHNEFELRLKNTPVQLNKAWAEGSYWAQRSELRRPSRVIVCAMGASAIGADMIAAACQNTTTVPIIVNKQNELPLVGEDDLVVAISFSGETQEVLNAFKQAEGTGAQRAVITEGEDNELFRYAQRFGLFAFTFYYPGPPRLSLPHLSLPLLALLHELGLHPGIDIMKLEREVEKVEQYEDVHRHIALHLSRSVPIIVGPSFMYPAAQRWAHGLSENAKQFALAVPLPELSHNLIASLENPESRLRDLRVVILTSDLLMMRDELLIEALKTELYNADLRWRTCYIEGSNKLEVLLRAAYTGDFVSLYTANLTGADPWAVPAIDRVKENLAE